MDGMIKVVRDGPRGWHWISAASFDAGKHVLWEPEAKKPTPKAAKKADDAVQQTKAE